MLLALALQLTAEEQAATFKLPPGYRIELVAADPDVLKIVDIAFDDAGRMWAVTASEYPVDGNEDPKAAELYKAGGKDQVLVFDTPCAAGRQKPRVYAKGLAMPMAVLPYKDGAFVGHGPDILFIKADGTREVVLTGFGIQDSHLLPHRFTRGPGGWVYLAQGAFNRSQVRARGAAPVEFNQCKVGRFKLDGSVFEVVGWGLNNIWGFVIDPRGQMWIQEANDLGYPLVPFHIGASYPGIGEHRHKPYSRWQPPLADFAMGGTGLSGLALSEDPGGFPAPYDGVFFVANPITSKVQAIRARLPKLEKLPDFIETSDTRFRPIAVHFGPDGCLYIVDWYNKIIQHNEAPRNHPDRDKVRSRVWRVRHESMAPRAIPDLTKVPDAELIGHLKSDSTWQARAAWHQIVDRPAKGLEWNGFANAPERQRVLASWAQGGGAESILALKDVPTLLKMVRPPLEGPTVRPQQTGQPTKTGEAGARDFERELIRAALEKLPRVKEFPNAEAQALAALAWNDAALLAAAKLDRPLEREELALLSTVPEALDRLLEDPVQAKTVLALLADGPPRSPERVAAALQGADPALVLRFAHWKLAALEPEMAAIAGKAGPHRLAALRALVANGSKRTDLFKSLLEPALPEDLKREAAAALCVAPAELFALWSKMPAGPRAAALDRLTATPAGARALLDALETGDVAADELTSRLLERMKTHLAGDEAFAEFWAGMSKRMKQVVRLTGHDAAQVDTNIDLRGPFTVEAWVKLDPGLTNQDGILAGPGAADFNFHDARFRVYIVPITADVVIARTATPPDAWTHVAATRDAKGAFKIYLNGVLDAEGTRPWDGELLGLDVARTLAGGGTAGWIAELRVWNRERTAREMLDAFDRSFAGELPPEGMTKLFPPWPPLGREARLEGTLDAPPLMTGAESRALLGEFERVRALAVRPGDVARGAALFAQTCGKCHKIKGVGGEIGPNLDGAPTKSVEELLRAILTPSAAMEPGYRSARIETTDGELLEGFRASEDASGVVLRRPDVPDRKIPHEEIKRSSFGRLSVMPEGLLKAMSDEDLAALFTYLKTPP